MGKQIAPQRMGPLESLKSDVVDIGGHVEGRTRPDGRSPKSACDHLYLSYPVIRSRKNRLLKRKVQT
jgi:hypothetical protein